MVTTFTYKPSVVRIDARNFELSWQQTHKQTNTQTGPITIHCAAKFSAQCNNKKEAKIKADMMMMMIIIITTTRSGADCLCFFFLSNLIILLQWCWWLCHVTFHAKFPMWLRCVQYRPAEDFFSVTELNWRRCTAAARTFWSHRNASRAAGLTDQRCKQEMWNRRICLIYFYGLF